MSLRTLTTKTRRQIEKIIQGLANGEEVSLEDRIKLNKYALHIPFIASKLDKALAKRNSQENNI